jgi:hypothetical protein
MVAELGMIWPRHPLTEVPDTDMWELTDERQHQVYEAVGNLLIAMFEGNDEPYVSDFVVVLNTGERVGYECLIANNIFSKHAMN